MQLWTSVEAITLCFKKYLLAPPLSPYPQVDYAYSVTFALPTEPTPSRSHITYWVWETDTVNILLNVCIIRACNDFTLA